MTLKATECNYDYLMLKIAHASAATQMLAFEMKTYANEDLASWLSGISDIASKVYVQTTSIASQTSNANSALISMMGSRMSGISDILTKFMFKQRQWLPILSP